jgi:serine/threonine protein kinase
VQRIGRYHVIRRLGHGGMGDVYLAHDDTLERDIAIKLVRVEADLRDEAKALAALRHPSIVTIFEIERPRSRSSTRSSRIRASPGITQSVPRSFATCARSATRRK